MAFFVPQGILAKTFAQLRQCGRGRSECQVWWTSPWKAPDKITSMVHPQHQAHAGGFAVDDAWLSAMWMRLADRGEGVRVQIHTHPGSAFHSTTDDQYPVIHTPGFLSLVIPDFGKGKTGFENAFLAEIGLDGKFREVPIRSRLKIA